MKVLIATIKSWNIKSTYKLVDKYSHAYEIKLVSKQPDLLEKVVYKFDPDYIFFPHWSYMIPESIFSRWNCIVSHMTDLPFGCGGSSLQNLIIRGFRETKISAIQVSKELDGGPIYMQSMLSLEGSAEDIFKRASRIIFEEMIPKFLTKKLVLKEQSGEVTVFKRRSPKESELQEDMDLCMIYDYIRMLDAEGYPNAFLRFGRYRLEFQTVSFVDGKLSASVNFKEKTE
mgnify:FL=1